LATVEMLLGLYPAEITTSVRSWPVEDPITTFLPLFLADDRIAEVLSTCTQVQGEDATIQEVLAGDPLAAARVCGAVLSLCDVPRIVRSFDFDPERAAVAARVSVPDPTENPAERGKFIVLLAERFGRSPLEIPDWPYEAILSIQESLTGEGLDASAHSTPAARGVYPDGAFIGDLN